MNCFVVANSYRYMASDGVRVSFCCNFEVEISFVFNVHAYIHCVLLTACFDIQFFVCAERYIVLFTLNAFSKDTFDLFMCAPIASQLHSKWSRNFRYLLNFFTYGFHFAHSIFKGPIF